MTVRRVYAALLAALALGLLTAAPAAAETDTGWTIESFDTTVAVETDGSLTVTESIAVDFAGLERRGIFRMIPVRYLIHEGDTQVEVPEGRQASEFRRVLEITDVEVTSTAPDQIQLTEERGHLRIRIGDPDITVSGPQRYEIRYRAQGALNSFETHEELYWNATGDEWPVPMRRASVTVSAPEVREATCFLGEPGSTRLCTSAADGGPRFLGEDLLPGEGMTVVVAMAPGAVAVPPPVIEEVWTLPRALTGSPLAVPLTGLTALLGLGGVGLLAYRQGRDRVARGDTTIDGQVDHGAVARRPLLSRPSHPVQFRPPEGLRPAQLGLIVDERVDPVEISATIVDLGVRGHLVIEERSDGRRWRSKTDWALKRVPNDEPLLDYERYLLDQLFAGRSEVLVSDLKGEFADSYRQTAKRIYKDGATRGWFPRNPEHTRQLWLGIGIVATLAAGGLLALALTTTTVALAAVPLVVAGVVLALAHRRMPHRTAQGSRLLGEALGFKEFIATAEADRMDFAESENLFERYLPYAIVFGCVDRWARTFAHLAEAGATTASVGGWYAWHGGGRPNLDTLASGLSDFSNTVGTSLSYSPPSSGSSGGSSGGGSGGGGGGSW